MAPRTSWKGFLKLSLVSVPVKAFTANNTSEEVRLNQLHDGCHNRVRYKKVCPEHGELKANEIVSGYEYSKDQYVVIDPEEVQKLRSISDRSINIDGFVSPDDVDPVYFAGKAYYLMPDGAAGGKPYALLLRGMVDANVIGIAQVVLSGREQLVMIRPVENMLVMTVLSYAKRVRAIDEFTREIGQQKMTKEELALADTLIKASIIDGFDIERYKDEYVEKLQKLIQMKIDGEEIVQVPDVEEPKIINLMDALKKSVAEAQLGGRKKMAPSEKAVGKKKAAAKKPAVRRKKTG